MAPELPSPHTVSLPKELWDAIPHLALPLLRAFLEGKWALSIQGRHLGILSDPQPLRKRMATSCSVTL